MLNIVIPMAGKGSRFANAGYKKPKPLIEINGKPMIELVIKNLSPNIPHRFIFIVQKMHIGEYDLKNLLNKCCHEAKIVEIDYITKGAACTVLEAEEYINNENPLMIANSDQWIDMSIDDYLESWFRSKYEGFIMTMKADDPKWSFVKFDKYGKIIDVVEKEVVSDEATVGIYNFKKGNIFCKFAHKMIQEKDLSKGEYYVAPVYKYLIKDNYEIGLYNVAVNNGGEMYGLGTPDDLNYFLKKFPNPII